MPVVHADVSRLKRRWKRCASEAFAWIAGIGELRDAVLRTAMPGNDEGKERKRKSEAERRQTQFVFCRTDGPGRPSQRRGAHLSAFHHGSRPKESFIARDSASGHASWEAIICHLTKHSRLCNIFLHATYGDTESWQGVQSPSRK